MCSCFILKYLFKYNIDILATIHTLEEEFFQKSDFIMSIMVKKKNNNEQTHGYIHNILEALDINCSLIIKL